MTVVTAVVFSATLVDAVPPPPLLVITGVESFASVTFTVIVCVSVCTPSEAWTVTT